MSRSRSNKGRKEDVIANRSRSFSNGKPRQALVEDANKWREKYNPLRGLTMEKAANVLDRGLAGDFSELQWLYYTIERRFPTLGALVKKRVSAIKRLKWEIKIRGKLPKGATEAQAEEQRDALHACYEQIDNLNESFQWLAIAEFRGFSILQKHRGKDGSVVHLEPLNHWNLIRDGLAGDFWWNPAAAGKTPESMKGTPPLSLEECVLRECPWPIDEVALAYFIRANLASKDWAAFLEIYGIPGVVVVGPPDVPSDKAEDYKSAAESVAAGGSGYLPNGSSVQFADGPRQSSPFKEALDDIRQEVVLAGTSGKLTMLNDATGLGSGNADSHDSTFDALAEAEAMEISEVLQKSIDAEFLARTFPGQPRLVYFELSPKEQADTSKVVADVEGLSRAGFIVSEEQVEGLTGYDVELKPAPTSPFGAPGAPGTPPEDQNAQGGDPESGDGASSADGEDGGDGKEPGAEDTTPEPLANRRWGVANRAAADAIAQKKLVDRVAENVAGVSSKYLAPVRSVFEDLVAKAEANKAGKLPDQAFIDALDAAAKKMPELFGELDVNLVSKSLEEAMGAAVVNGAAEHHNEATKAQP